MNTGYILLLSFFITGCTTVARYHKKAQKLNVPIIKAETPFDGKLIKDTIAYVSAQKLSEYANTEKVLWIRYWVPYCNNNTKEVELAKKYSDKVDLIWLAVLWDYPLVQKQMELYAFPIYYIDQHYEMNRSKLVKKFTSDVLTTEINENVSSNVFIKNGQIIFQCYSDEISDALIKELLK